MDSEAEAAFYRRWQIAAPAMVFDDAGRRDPDGLPIALVNLSNRVASRVWGAGIATAPATSVTVLLAGQRPWLPASALSKCSIILSKGGCIDVYGNDQDTLNEAVAALSRLTWWAKVLSCAGDAAWRQCSAALSQRDVSSGDPTEVEAVALLLTTLAIGGHA